MVQRQIGSRTSVMVGYYGRRFWNLYTTVNDAVPSTAYSPVTIANPLTNEPLTVYNQDPATRGQVRKVLKTIPDLEQRYNGDRIPVQHADVQGDGLRRLHHRQQLRRPGQRRSEQPERPHQQPRRHRVRFAVSDPRRVQLPAAGRHAAVRVDPRGRRGCRRRAPTS